MELFERIRYLCEIKEVSLSKMAKKLGIPQQTFHQWLKPGSQKNIWEHLPKILELFPDARPEWLYMGEEPAFRDGTCAEPGPTKESIAALEAENARLRQELDEERALNRQLTARLLVDGSGDAPPAGELARRTDGGSGCVG